MYTECNTETIEFSSLFSRSVKARFDGGHITSDAGGLFLREVDDRLGLTQKLAECFTDFRDPNRIDHTVVDLIAQRVFGICLGYEDLNDHDQLRYDPLLAAMVGKEDPTGRDRSRDRDKGKALAGRNTLNRLELTSSEGDPEDRYRKIRHDPEKIMAFFLEIFFVLHSPSAPDRIILDLDATDDPLHGEQEGRFFHKYYDCYCYLPLYIFCGSHLLGAKLRRSDQDGCAGSKEELARIVPAIRERWPDTEIWIRGDSGFCREWLMSWCEENGVEYVLGIARNPRLAKAIEEELGDVGEIYRKTGETNRILTEFTYSTLSSWSRRRRVVAKAEHMASGSNPRFVVTSLDAEQYSPTEIYEEIYCARGDMENRIKEQQRDLFAVRTSTEHMESNQLRLWFSSAAYTLMNALRILGLAGTEMETAQCGTIRTKLFKIGARIRVTVRNVWVSLSESYPWKDLFRTVWNRLTAHPVGCG